MDDKVEKRTFLNESECEFLPTTKILNKSSVQGAAMIRDRKGALISELALTK